MAWDGWQKAVQQMDERAALPAGYHPLAAPGLERSKLITCLLQV